MKRIIVCGGRDYADAAQVARVLQRVWVKHPDAQLIEGGARGADTLGRIWATANAKPYLTVPAQWDLYGKSAGFKRNEAMADLPDVIGVVAFPGGKGTQHMIDIATKRGIPVLRVPRV